MSNISENISNYFHTDWAAMTLHDWIGLGITIIVFLVMIALYLYIFNPANKERLEAHKNIPLDDDVLKQEDSK